MPHQLRPQHIRLQQDLATPLAVEFEELPWPPRFKPTILPQFDGESDPKDFLLKYKAAIEASGSDVACKVKAFVLSLKALAQHWYSNIPGGHIHTWDQLRRELTVAIRAPKPEEVNSCAFHNLKQGGSSLQEYLHNLVKLRARAPNVDEKTIIDAAIAGLSLSPCGEYLERCRPKTLSKLFEIMQEYCVSDKGKRRRIEETNANRGRNRDRPNQHQTEQTKTAKAVNTVSGDEARDSRPQNNRGGGE